MTMKIKTKYKKAVEKFAKMFESNEENCYDRLLVHEAGHKTVGEVIHPELKQIYTIERGMPTVTILNTTRIEDVWDDDHNFLDNYVTEKLAGYAAEMLCYDYKFRKASDIIFNHGKLAVELDDEDSRDFDEYAAYHAFKSYRVPEECIKDRFINAIDRAQYIICSHKDRWVHHYDRACKYFGSKIDEIFI